jgi:ParB-like chromosome segregation protein Spo0J
VTVRIPETLQQHLVPMEELAPHPRNANNGDIDAIAQSLMANGMFRPVVVQRSTGYILAGNHTYAAMASLGEAEIPAYYLDVTDAQALKIMLADNRTAQLAVMDDGLLIDLLREVGANDAANFFGTGYTDADLLDLLKQSESRLHPYASIDGASRVTPTPDESLDAYRANATRSLVLTYRLEEWEPLAAMLRAARARYDADNNATALLSALEELFPQEANQFSTSALAE